MNNIHTIFLAISICATNILIGSEVWKSKVPFLNEHPKYKASSSFHDKYSSDKRVPFHAIWVQNQVNKRISCWFIYVPIQKIVWREDKDKHIYLFFDFGNKDIKALKVE